MRVRHLIIQFFSVQMLNFLVDIEVNDYMFRPEENKIVAHIEIDVSVILGMVNLG